MSTFTTGQIVWDRIEQRPLVVIEDRVERVLLSTLAALRPGASLIDRAQFVLPATDIEPMEAQP